jgi:hypothetical protein
MQLETKSSSFASFVNSISSADQASFARASRRDTDPRTTAMGIPWRVRSGRLAEKCPGTLTELGALTLRQLVGVPAISLRFG